MPTPGVQSQILGKSGGNKFQGEIYQDYENNSLIAENIEGNLPDEVPLRRRPTPSGIRLRSNEMQNYRDFNVNVGGPIKKDKVWWYFSYRNQKTSVGAAELHRRHFGHAVRHQALEPLGQDDLSDEPEQQADRLLPVGPEEQPNRLPSATNSYDRPRRDAGAALRQLDLQG